MKDPPTDYAEPKVDKTVRFYDCSIIGTPFLITEKTSNKNNNNKTTSYPYSLSLYASSAQILANQTSNEKKIKQSRPPIKRILGSPNTGNERMPENVNASYYEREIKNNKENQLNIKKPT